MVGNLGSIEDDSFSHGLLEYPHYTRPASYRGWEVPEVLTSGDHARVARWRRAQALVRTARHRPELLAARGGLSPADEAVLAEFDLMAELSALDLQS
jgi:tRNA (guanine37-N1)-methyltransferase